MYTTLNQINCFVFRERILAFINVKFHEQKSVRYDVKWDMKEASNKNFYNKKFL